MQVRLSKFLFALCSAAFVLQTPVWAESVGSGGALMGLAAITAAIAPVGVAGIQADADAKIAGIQAQTQMAITDRQATTSETIATMQSQTASALSMISANTSLQANQGVTERLAMQLAEQRSARQLQAQLDAQAQAQQFAIANRRLDLEEKMAAVQAQIAALTSGARAAPSIDSGSALAVTRYGIAQPQSGNSKPTPSARLLAAATAPVIQPIVEASAAFAPPRGVSLELGRVRSVGIPRTIAAADSEPEWRSRNALASRAIYDSGASAGGHGAGSGHSHAH